MLFHIYRSFYAWEYSLLMACGYLVAGECFFGGDACSQGTVVVNLREYQQVRYVSIERGADITWGGSRQGPWLTLHYALSRITDASPSNRYVILLGGGVYTGVDTTAFVMKPFVDVYGGFEPYNWTRDIVKNASVLDGEGSRRVVRAARDSRLDGVRITGGVYNYPYDVYGAGILFDLVAGSILSNSVLDYNKGVNGGAICCRWCSPRILNCSILTNEANGGTGGALCCWEESSPSLEGCLIRGNSSLTEGGAIYCRQNSSPAFINCFVVENSANAGGALYCLSSSPTFINCTLTRNQAVEGGLLSIRSGKPLFRNCILWSNTGFSLLTTSTNPILENCVVPVEWLEIASKSLCVDPMYVEKGDYHLQQGSPCLSQAIGPGTDSSVPVKDYDGEVRTGKVCDIGADERVLDEPTRTPAPTLSPTRTLSKTPTRSPTPSRTASVMPRPTVTHTPTTPNHPAPTETAVLGDLDQDGSIGSSDLLILQSLWQQGPKDVEKRAKMRP